MADRKDPFRNFMFRVELGNIQQLGFSEVSGIDTTIDPVDYRDGTDPKHVRKLSGLTKYNQITLKRGTTDSVDVFNWIKKGIEGEVDRQNISIVLLDVDGSTEKARWNIVQAWPAKYSAPTFNAKNSEVAIESMEIQHEGIVRVL